MGKATEQFRRRDNAKGGFEDCRDFAVWYDYEDVRRILWKMFTLLPAKTRALFLQPHVFFDGIDGRDIGEILTISAKWLRDAHESVRYFPFVFKPELAGAHYIAGVFVKVAALGMTLVLFNPVGGLRHLDLKNLDKLIDLKASPHSLQTAKKDGGKLVSCGPLSLCFLDAIFNHPTWLETVEKEFTLPQELTPFMEDPPYKERVLALRKQHDGLLETVADKELDSVEEFYEPFNHMLLKALDVSDRKKKIEQIYWENDFFEEESGEENLDDSNPNSGSVSEEEEELGPKGLPAPEVANKDSAIEPLLSPHEKRSMPVDVMTSGCAKRLDVQAVEAEIHRLRHKTGLASWGCTEKSKTIEQALHNALKDDDVRLNVAVREALARHRIGFFGKTRALINVDESLVNKAHYSTLG